MREKKQQRNVADIFADMAAIGPFLPGSVRTSKDKRTNKKGEVVVYEAQPIFTYRIGRGRYQCKRIPKDAFPQVKALVENHHRFQSLLSELEAAMVELYLADPEKKTTSCRRAPSCHASPTWPPRSAD